MTYSWNQTFEGFPAGSSQGHTMGLALRRLKGAFYERFIVEHTITESATPTVLHLVGECGIVLIVEEDDTPLSEYIDGGIQYKAPAFYRDTGSALSAILSNDHGAYVGLGDDDHPQYVKLAGGTYTGGLNIDKVTGLSTTGTDFTSTDPNRILSEGGHSAVDGDSLSYHETQLSDTDIDALTDATAFYLNAGKIEYSDISDTGAPDIETEEDKLSPPTLSGISGAGNYVCTSRGAGATYGVFWEREDTIAGTLNSRQWTGLGG